MESSNTTHPFDLRHLTHEEQEVRPLRVLLNMIEHIIHKKLSSYLAHTTIPSYPCRSRQLTARPQLQSLKYSTQALLYIGISILALLIIILSLQLGFCIKFCVSVCQRAKKRGRQVVVDATDDTDVEDMMMMEDGHGEESWGGKVMMYGKDQEKV